ncbi:hypothetical protein KY331_05945 [Candidatus Woesearchaeota archaeon]|nr:hypothetical protein [Candidatus Woesearchaeota archaeon]
MILTNIILGEGEVFVDGEPTQLRQEFDSEKRTFTEIFETVDSHLEISRTLYGDLREGIIGEGHHHVSKDLMEYCLAVDRFNIEQTHAYIGKTELRTGQKVIYFRRGEGVAGVVKVLD